MKEELEIDPERLFTHLPVWLALSKIFAPEPLTTADEKEIATALLASSLSIEKDTEILWREVFPALVLMIEPPEDWSFDFSESSVRDAIVLTLRRPWIAPRGFGMLGVQKHVAHLEGAWQRIRRHLPAEYSHSFEAKVRKGHFDPV